MSKSKPIETLTLIGKSIFEYGKEEDHYCIDLTDRYYYSVIVKAKVERSMSAFFYQLSKVKEELATIEPETYKDRIEITDLVYVDFDSLFRYEKKKNRDRFMDSIFKDGLKLICMDDSRKKTVMLKPFDKSASMSRKSMITFINENYKERMDERLTLGMFDPDKQYPLSKVSAYRGDYLSSGYRIECTDDFKLDEKRVVIINDITNKTRDERINAYTEVVSYNSDPEKQRSPEYGIVCYTGERKAKKVLEIKTFDGEGIISKETADCLRKSCAQEKMRDAESASSFQVRMPFVKGMLHTVDFKKFLKEEMDIDIEKAEIEDCFGIKRKIKDVEIIMPQSMFKAHRWVMNSQWGRDGNDPMKEYFKQFAKNDHALYVLKTDKNLPNPGYIKFSYQFLNTSSINDQDLRGLIQDSLNSYPRALSNSQAVREGFIKSGVLQPLEDDDDLKSDNKITTVINEKPSVIFDPKIEGMIQGTVESLYIKATEGNFLIDGENRFLSGDLLYYLRDIAKNIDKDNPKLKEFENWLKTKKKNNQPCFYAAQAKNGIEWKPGEEYALLRNPHLSRNEQCVLSSYVPEKTGKDYYQEYLGDLSGVVMLPYASPIAERLSGADFDGDLVKLIDNEIINTSAKECFENTPMVFIPHEEEKAKKITELFSYSSIKDGFGSRVGELSNAAIRIGQIQYNKRLPEVDSPINSFDYNKEPIKLDDYSQATVPSDLKVLSDNCVFLLKLDSDWEKAKDDEFDARVRFLKELAQELCSDRKTRIVIGGGIIDGEDTAEEDSSIRKTYEYAEIIKHCLTSFAGDLQNSGELQNRLIVRGLGRVKAPNESFSTGDGLIVLSNKESDPGKRIYHEGKDYVAISCILVGQEIDKAKTGMSPYTEEIMSVSSQSKSWFIDNKDSFESIKFSTLTVEDEAFVFKKRNRDVLKMEKPGLDCSTLDKLPYYVIEEKQIIITEDKQKKQQTEEKGSRERTYYKSFGNNELIDTEVLESFGVILLVYSEMKEYVKLRNRIKTGLENSIYYRKIFNTMNIQYDVDAPGSISKAIRQLYRLVDKLGENDDKYVWDILESIINDNWQFTPKEKREETLSNYFSKEKYGNVPYDDYDADLAVAKRVLSNFSCKGYTMLYYLIKDCITDRGYADNNSGSHSIRFKKNIATLTVKLIQEEIPRAGKTWAKSFAELLTDYLSIDDCRDLLDNRNDNGNSLVTVDELQRLLKCPSGKSFQKLKSYKATWALCYEIIEKVSEIWQKYEISYQDLYEEYWEHDALKIKSGDEETDGRAWSEWMPIYCRAKLETLISEHNLNMGDATKYWNQLKDLDKSHSFLWDVFTAEEIIDAVVEGD